MSLFPNKVCPERLNMVLSTARASPICTIAAPSLLFKNFTYKNIQCCPVTMDSILNWPILLLNPLLHRLYLDHDIIFYF